MRILHIINSLEVGGAQRILSGLLPKLKQQGEDVSLLVLNHEESAFYHMLRNSGISISCLHRKNRDPRILIDLRRIMRTYDAVHVHLFPSLYWASLASIGIKNVKLIWTEHSTSNKRRNIVYFRPIEKFIYGRYHKLISISDQTQTSLQSWLQSYDKRFFVVNNGVDLSEFQISRPVIPNSLIMVSRFVESKDQETVIRSLQFIDEHVTLRFVGDGPTKEHCIRLANELGVSSRVSFLGTRSDIPQLIAESYIGIQSSHWEGFGLTAVELMASGKPVVASDVDGLRQVVDGAGVIFKQGNEKQLAGFINKLIDDQEFYKEISDRCKQRSLVYSMTQMAQNYKEIYHTL